MERGKRKGDRGERRGRGTWGCGKRDELFFIKISTVSGTPTVAFLLLKQT